MPVQYTFAPTHSRVVQLPYYFQGKRPACGAHAGTYLKVFLNRRDGTNTTENDTPRYLWISIKRDGTSPSDGTDMTSIFKSLQTYGSDTFEPLENDVTFDDMDYASVKFLTPAMSAAASGNTISSYAFPADMSFNGIKQTIHDFGHALVLVHANAQMWTAPDGTTSWAEKDVLPLRPPTEQYPVVSGHFLFCDSYDEKYIYGPNSFSTDWGRNGDFYFGAGYTSQIIEMGIAHNSAKATSQQTVDAAKTVLQPIPSLINEVDALPAAEQPYYRAILNQILATIRSWIMVPLTQGSASIAYMTETKALVASWTFWFGFLQILLGIVGLFSGLMDHQTAFTLIVTGLGSIGFRLNTSAPIGSVFPH